jgi:hypothetical protein
MTIDPSGGAKSRSGESTCQANTLGSIAKDGDPSSPTQPLFAVNQHNPSLWFCLQELLHPLLHLLLPSNRGSTDNEDDSDSVRLVLTFRTHSQLFTAKSNKKYPLPDASLMVRSLEE